jgi:hypothetical protein
MAVNGWNGDISAVISDGDGMGTARRSPEHTKSEVGQLLLQAKRERCHRKQLACM